MLGIHNLLRTEYESLEAAMDAIRAHRRAHGYAMVRKRSKPMKDAPGPRIVYLECDRHGQHVSTSAGHRNASTRANGCLFSIVLRRIDADQWDVDIRPHRHNHPASRSAAAHPSLRQIDMQAAASTVDTLLSVGTRPNRIHSAVLQLEPTSAFTSRDLYNTIAKTRREKLGGLSNIEALIKLLKNNQDI